MNLKDSIAILREYIKETESSAPMSEFGRVATIALDFIVESIESQLEPPDPERN